MLNTLVETHSTQIIELPNSGNLCVPCPECGIYANRASMLGHMSKKHADHKARLVNQTHRVFEKHEDALGGLHQCKHCKAVRSSFATSPACANTSMNIAAGCSFHHGPYAMRIHRWSPLVLYKDHPRTRHPSPLTKYLIPPATTPRKPSLIRVTPRPQILRYTFTALIRSDGARGYGGLTAVHRPAHR